MKINFEEMTVDEAVEYCYKHQKQYVAEVGYREFECLIAIVKYGTIQPSELPSYGMDYDEE